MLKRLAILVALFTFAFSTATITTHYAFAKQPNTVQPKKNKGDKMERAEMDDHPKPKDAKIQKEAKKKNDEKQGKVHPNDALKMERAEMDDHPKPHQ